MLYEKPKSLEERIDLPLNGPGIYRVRDNLVCTNAIEINAVRQCNLSCRSCSHSAPLAERKVMSIEQVIKDLFEKLMKDNDEKNKEINILNDRIKNYTKQNGFNNLNIKEIEILKNTVKTQNKTIVDTMSQLEGLKNGVNQLNEFLSLNEKDGKLDVKKITKVFNQYNEKINDVNTKLNKSKKDYEAQIETKIASQHQKDINTGKYLFGQFFANVSQFSIDLYNYGFKDDN